MSLGLKDIIAGAFRDGTAQVQYNEIAPGAVLGAGGVPTDAGAANAYTLTYTSGTNPTILGNGMVFGFNPANTNTGASTLNVAGLGAKNIYVNGAVAYAGAIVVGVPAFVEYDGTKFNLINPVTPAQNGIQHVTVNLTTANLKAMYAAPVQIVAAPAGSLRLVVINAVVHFTYGTAVFTGGGDVVLQYAATANGAGTNVSATVVDTGATVFTGGASAVMYNMGVGNQAVPAATGIYISNKTGALASATGTSTATVDIWYMVV